MRPCPFCQSNNVRVIRLENNFGRTYVQCQNCYVKGPVIDSLHMNSEMKKKKAIELWNGKALGESEK